MNGYRVTNCHALIADIGATHSRVAMVLSENLTQYENVEIYQSATFSGPDEIILHYCQVHNITVPNMILLAIAAPVELDDIQFVNNHWSFKLSVVRLNLAPASVYFYNDVEMLAYALPHLPDSVLLQVGGGSLDNYAPKLALSLGSGVGTSLLVHHYDWLAIPSEGGHASMMMDDLFTVELWQFLSEQQNGQEVIVEDFIAGKKGIPQLMMFMQKDLDDLGKKYSPNELIELLNYKKDAFVTQLFSRYCAMIGNVAKNYTLITGAKSVYLAGGIVPRFLEFFVQSDFRLFFEKSVSVGLLLEKIPTYVITDPYPALTGLAQKVAYMEEKKSDFTH